MANTTNIFDLINDTYAAFLATAVSDGTYADVLSTLKVDAGGQATAATQVATSAGQLWSNACDDYIGATYATVRNLARGEDAAVGELTLRGVTYTFPAADGSSGQVLSTDGAGALSWIASGATPIVSTDHAIARFDGVAGALQDSAVTISDAGNLTMGVDDPIATIGNALGSPSLRLTKLDTEQSRLEFRNAGALSWTFQHDSNEVFRLLNSADATVFSAVTGTNACRVYYDFTVSGNQTLSSASPTLTVGDNSGSPVISSNKVAGGNGQLIFRTGGVQSWGLNNNTVDDLLLSKAGGAAVLRFNQTTSLANFEGGDVTLGTASPNLTVGDGTGDPDVIVNKSETGTGRIILQKLGGQSWAIKNNASENLLITRVGDANTITCYQTNGAVQVHNDLTVNGSAEIDGALNHDGTLAGFFGAANVTQPVVTGATTAAAVDSAISALASLGLVTDSTTGTGRAPNIGWTTLQGVYTTDVAPVEAWDFDGDLVGKENALNLTEVGSTTVYATAGGRSVLNLLSQATSYTQSDASFQITGDLTVSMMVYVMRATSSAQVYYSQAGSGETTPANCLYQYAQQVQQDELFWEYAGAANELFDMPAMPQGRWMHHVFRRDTTAKTASISIDGIERFSIPYTNNPTDGSSSTLTLFGSSGSSNRAQCLCAGIGIWDSLLTDSQVMNLAVYAYGGTP